MIEQHRKRLKEAFSSYLSLPLNLEPHLRDALVHMLGTPGSQVRPEIVLEISPGCGLSEGDAIGLASAPEYFHTASLLFNDLPSMDDASKRRGVPCAHLQFGDAGAILAALALVNRACALTRRLIAIRPTVNFLEPLRGELGEEALQFKQSLTREAVGGAE
jgi:geranylgeranyl pyrophosphate synthase